MFGDDIGSGGNGSWPQKSSRESRAISIPWDDTDAILTCTGLAGISSFTFMTFKIRDSESRDISPVHDSTSRLVNETECTSILVYARVSQCWREISDSVTSIKRDWKGKIERSQVSKWYKVKSFNDSQWNERTADEWIRCYCTL